MPPCHTNDQKSCATWHCQGSQYKLDPPARLRAQKVTCRTIVSRTDCAVATTSQSSAARRQRVSRRGTRQTVSSRGLLSLCGSTAAAAQEL